MMQAPRRAASVGARRTDDMHVPSCQVESTSTRWSRCHVARQGVTAVVDDDLLGYRDNGSVRTHAVISFRRAMASWSAMSKATRCTMSP